MGWIPDRYQELRRLLRPESAEEEIDEEMAQHFELLVERLLRSGMSPLEARAEASRRFGDLDAYRSETRAIARKARIRTARRERLQTWLGDLWITVRSLGRRPGFSVAVLATLVLSLAGTAVTFTLIDTVLLRPLPYSAPDELVVVRHPVPGLEEGQEWNLSAAGYFFFQQNARSLQGLGIWSGTHVSVAGDEGAERAIAALVSGSLLRVLEARPALGRLLDDSDNRPGAPLTVVLDHGFWRQRYGSDPDIVGRVVTVNSAEREVVGVLEPGFGHPILDAQLWMPLELDPTARPVNSHIFQSIGRLAPGTDRQTAERELAGFTTQLPELFPEAYSEGFMDQYRFGLAVHRLQDDVVGSLELLLWILVAAALLVLVVATSNVAGLFLVRAEARRHEMAIRSSLGASVGRLTWHGASEAVLLVTGSAVVALALASAVLRVLDAAELESLEWITSPSVSPGAALAVVVTAALVAAGLGSLTRALPVSPVQSLREGGTAGTTPRRRSVRELMIVGQITVALVLVTGAGLLLRSAINLGRVDSGLDTDGSWMASVALPPVRYGGYEEAGRFFQQLSERMEALPGIRSVGATNAPPLSGQDGCALIFVEGRPLASDERPPCVATPMVAPGYFDALGIPVRGRAPGWSEIDAGEVVVSRAFADRFWPGEDPIGRGVKGNGDEPPFYRVVGVAADVRADGLDRPPEEAVYFPLMPIEGAPLWSPLRSATLTISTEGTSQENLAAMLRREISALDPEVPVSDLRSVAAVVSRSTARRSFAATLVGTAAALAVLLAALGIYGLLAYLVGNRRAEIGVRMALGADPADVLRMIVLRSLLLTVFGLVAGLVGSVLLSRSLESMLFEVSPLDPATMALATALILAIVLLASVAPARRAAAVNPVQALRTE